VPDRCVGGTGRGGRGGGRAGERAPRGFVDTQARAREPGRSSEDSADNTTSEAGSRGTPCGGGRVGHERVRTGLRRDAVGSRGGGIATHRMRFEPVAIRDKAPGRGRSREAVLPGRSPGEARMSRPPSASRGISPARMRWMRKDLRDRGGIKEEGGVKRAETGFCSQPATLGSNTHQRRPPGPIRARRGHGQGRRRKPWPRKQPWGPRDPRA